MTLVPRLPHVSEQPIGDSGVELCSFEFSGIQRAELRLLGLSDAQIFDLQHAVIVAWSLADITARPARPPRRRRIMRGHRFRADEALRPLLQTIESFGLRISRAPRSRCVAILEIAWGCIREQLHVGYERALRRILDGQRVHERPSA